MYELRAPGTKRALLKVVITNAPPRLAEQIERHLLNFEDSLNNCEVLAGKRLGEHLGSQSSLTCA